MLRSLQPDPSKEMILGIASRTTDRGITKGTSSRFAKSEMISGACPKADRLKATEAAAFAADATFPVGNRGALERENNLHGLSKAALDDVALKFGKEVLQKHQVDVADVLFASACHGMSLPCATSPSWWAPSACVDATLATRLALASDEKYCSRFAGSNGGLESTTLSWQVRISSGRVLFSFCVLSASRCCSLPTSHSCTHTLSSFSLLSLSFLFFHSLSLSLSLSLVFTLPLYLPLPLSLSLSLSLSSLSLLFLSLFSLSHAPLHTFPSTATCRRAVAQQRGRHARRAQRIWCPNPNFPACRSTALSLLWYDCCISNPHHHQSLSHPSLYI